MTKVSAAFPDELIDELDEASRRLNRSRDDLIRQAVEHYLEDLEDLQLGLERLQDDSDPILPWDEVACDLLDRD